MLWLLVAGPAWAFDCADIDALVQAGVATKDIVAAVEERGGLGADTLACVKASNVAPDLVLALGGAQPLQEKGTRR